MCQSLSQALLERVWMQELSIYFLFVGEVSFCWKGEGKEGGGNGGAQALQMQHSNGKCIQLHDFKTRGWLSLTSMQMPWTLCSFFFSYDKWLPSTPKDESRFEIIASPTTARLSEFRRLLSWLTSFYVTFAYGPLLPHPHPATSIL